MNKDKSNQENGIPHRILSGFGVLLVRDFFLKIIAFFGQIILAHILSPSDFGFYVIIAFVITLFGLFSDIGLSFSIIQKKDMPTQFQLSSVFFLKLFLTTILICFLFIFSSFLHTIYPSLTTTHITMIKIFSFNLILNILQFIPVALLEREINYTAVSVIDIVGLIVYQTSVIFFALSGFHVWSFIFAALMMNLAEVIVAFVYKPWVPNMYFDFHEIKELVHFGLFIQGSGIVNFLNTAIIPIIGGVKLGPYAVGLLDWANTIASVPESITNSYGRVAFAGFSRIQENISDLSGIIEDSIRVLSIITFLFAILIFGFSKEAADIIYTSKWAAGVPALYWFAGNVFFIPITASVGQGILVLGKSRSIFIITAISNAIGWTLSYIFIFYFSYIGIAIGFFLMQSILFILYLFLAKRNGIMIHLPKLVSNKLIISFFTLILIVIMNNLFPKGTIILISKVLISLCIYIFLILLYAKNDLKLIRDEFFNFF